MLPRAAVALFIVVVMTRPGLGHDYWLQPQRFLLSAGETTQVHLFVGDHFSAETERPFQAKQTVAFQLFSRHGSRDLKVTATDGEKPVGTMAAERAGSHLIVMERDWSHIKIEAAKFNKYLKHEGLTEVLQMRRKSGEDKTAGRERYRRYLKALVQVGDKSDQTYARKIGHRLEILPRTDPYASNKGDRFAVSVLFEGKPLRGAQVAAYNRNGDDTTTQETRTDDNGQAQLLLDRSGLWLIRLVHMQRCENVRGYEWESFWAAYSFQLK